MADKTRQNFHHPEIIETWVDNSDGTYSLKVAATTTAAVGGSTEATLATRLSEADFDTKTGALTETAPATDTASSGTNGRLQRIAQRITSLIALLPSSLGTKTAANSLSVTTSSDDALVSLNGAVTETAPATDTASSGLNGRLQRIAQRLTSLIGLFPTALGGTTAANSFPVTLSTDGPFVSQTGSITETAPATDTASSGLNGRLQRIAQRITSLIALVPAALVSGRFDVNIGAAPASLTIGTPGAGPYPTTGFAPAAPTCTFTRGSNTTAYTIGDEVGTAGTAPTTIAVGRVNAGTGVILGATAVYSNAPTITPNLVLMLFSATTTLAGDNAQLALSDAHAALCIGFIPLTASQDGSYSAGARVTSGNLILMGAPTAPIHFVCGASETTIYACLVTLNAFTPIANSETVSVTLSVEQN